VGSDLEKAVGDDERLGRVVGVGAERVDGEHAVVVRDRRRTCSVCVCV
jgi:hypothetical protein